MKRDAVPTRTWPRCAAEAGVLLTLDLDPTDTTRYPHGSYAGMIVVRLTPPPTAHVFDFVTVIDDKSFLPVGDLWFSFLGKRVVYFGRTAGSHVERFPPIAGRALVLVSVVAGVLVG